MAKEKRDYSRRYAEEYNFWRGLFMDFVTKILYTPRFKLVYRLEVHGKENIPKDNDYIICPNHLSTLDPPLMGVVFPRHLAFMTKKELFDIPVLKTLIDWLGAFAVDRANLAPSTIKTVKEIRKSEWVFSIFPQGTRQTPGKIYNVTKAFAGLGKMTKCNILPVGIIGTNEAKWKPFSGKIIVNIGKPIPYSDDLEGVKDEWLKQIQELTGFEYVSKAEQTYGAVNDEA